MANLDRDCIRNEGDSVWFYYIKTYKKRKQIWVISILWTWYHMHSAVYIIPCAIPIFEIVEFQRRYFFCLILIKFIKYFLF